MGKVLNPKIFDKNLILSSISALPSSLSDKQSETKCVL